MASEPLVDGVEAGLLGLPKAWLSVVDAEVPRDGGEDDTPDTVVILAVHQVVAASVLVEVLGFGHRVWLHDSCPELGVGGYKLVPPGCIWPEVIV